VVSLSENSCLFVSIRGYAHSLLSAFKLLCPSGPPSDGLVPWRARTHMSGSFSLLRKVWSIVKPLAILGHFLHGNDGGKIMIHLIWYILVGLIAGLIAKSVMHVHMTIFWTIVLGIIGSIIGGAVTHMFSRPVTGRFHPAGLIFSTLGAILVLYVCIKLNIHFPRVL
jgi:uncharacterized membrane protein YeaQ/YmgE (transglycosylase-associated protein family)